MTIKFLYESNKISARAFNVCKQNNFSSLEELYNKVIRVGGIKNLKLHNCGVKTIYELTKVLCDFLQHDETTATELQKSNTLNIFYLYNSYNFSELELEYIRCFTELTLKKLSVRSRNSINNYLDNDKSLKNLYKLIFTREEFEVIKLNNVGVKNEPEITFFLEKIIEEIEQLRNKEVPLNSQFKAIIEYYTKQSIDETTINTMVVSDTILLFKLLDYILKQQKDKQFVACLDYCYGFPNEKRTLEKLGRELGVTRERARQLVYKFDETFDLFFETIEPLLKYTKNYALQQLNLIKISDDSQNKFNTEECVLFTNKFYLLIFGKLYRQSHILLLGVGKEKHFLVNQKMASIFDFNAFQNNLLDLIEKDIREDYSLNFDEFIIKYFQNQREISLYRNRINKICAEIVDYVFPPSISLNGKEIIFHKNTILLIKEVAEKALKKLGKPSKLEDISKMAQSLYENFKVNPSSLRGVMQREKELFNFYAMRSTYGLVIWEEQNENLKRGTIRDLVEEIIQKADRPMHIYEIWQYVNRYRDNVKKNSLNTNLQSNRDRFVFLGSSFWGVKNRDYSSFKFNRTPKNLSIYMEQFLESTTNIDNPTMKLDFIEYFCEKYKLLPIQVQYVIDAKKINIPHAEKRKN